VVPTRGQKAPALSEWLLLLDRSLAGYAGVNSQVLQDVVLRLERAFRAFFRRVQAGETPG
jgi:putative transposase